MDNPNTNYMPNYNMPQQPVDDMSVGDWLITLILTFIPVVGFICLIVWAVGSSYEKRSRKNWAIAQFIISIIFMVLSILFVSCVGIGTLSLM